MPLREERHPGRSRARRILRWLPEVLVLALVAAAFATQGFDLSEKLFGAETTPASVAPPAGLDLPEQPVAEPVAGSYPAVAVDPALVRRALTPLIKDPRLGKHLVIAVQDLSGASDAAGHVVYRHGAGAFLPASTMKLLTSVAALDVLGPATRFRTTVKLTGRRLWLVGGGDPFLMSDLKAAKGLYPARGDLDTLAARTATALTERGVRVVRLAYDATLFTGPRTSPVWKPGYVPEEVVPITSLWVDEGKPGGRFAPDPAAAAGALFAKALVRHGIKVLGGIGASRAPSAAGEIATIASAPVDEIVEHTLAVSDNNAAEVLAHQVGLARGQGGSFAGGARSVTAVLRQLGVPMTGARIVDGSGLSRSNRLTSGALLGVLALAASPEGATLRALITGIPVAGFTGSLQYRFDDGPAEALGRVRAKTGTLTGVHGLAGIATGPDGSRMAFVAVADQVGEFDGVTARAIIDRIAAALGACRCAQTPAT